MAISSSLLTDYRHISTASIATTLFKKGLRNQFIQNVYPLNSKKMVGEAFTLRYIPAREDLNSIEVFKNPDHPQRKAIEQCPKNAVLVIDSRKDARAASAGSILITRLMKNGAAGIVTDGGFRDSQAIAALDFPSYHQRASAPTNLTLHQAIDINVPIGCGDVAVFPGDLIVGDIDGVIVIPAHLIEVVAKECLAMEKYEEFVLEKVHQGESIKGLYPLTDDKMKSQFERWKEKRS
ncbi:ribonuclease activity regulator RraA [Flagellimonas sp. S174]|uniref:ribonuclease activity regulator RraA n=1 Tax=Flagellimonas sp. S174 TaxID=3410790 RepID=UPI003BF5A8DE